MIDYHVHTPFCGHADGDLHDYVRRGVEQGLEEICFTPHAPLPGFPRGGEGLRMAHEDLGLYFESIERERGSFPEIRILAGIETDYYVGYEEYLGRLLESNPFDFVLLSIHFLAEWPGENWLFGYHFPDKSVEQVYREYFAALKAGIATGLYDCVAHLDLIKRPGQGVLDRVPEEVDEVLELCSRHNMSIELNSSGLRRAVAEIYPDPRVVGLAAARGIPLVTGSDAHDPEHVAYAFPELYRTLEGVPEARLTRYRGRVAVR
jgi:histidinol-phosphatase (PHP family)